MYLGIDAGGTKTFCLAGDAQGNILGFGRAGAGNYEVFGVEAARAEIWKAVASALEGAGTGLEDVAGIGMGIAGADVPEDYVLLDREIFKPMFGEIRRVFRNDSMGGLRGGTRKPFGVVIACGTGCVCAGKNREGQEARVGGISGEFGDKTSGSDIGIEGLKEVWRARDGIISPTLLTQKFVARAGCKDADDLFYTMYRRQKSYFDLEPMAPLVFEAAQEGDRAACDILEAGGRYLGEMVNGVARHLGMTREQFDVVMAGSVFKGSSPVLEDAMRLVIHRECPFARTVVPLYEPVVGAWLLGRELDGEITGPLYSTLDLSLQKLEQQHAVRLKME
ncbi:MAG: hypothetical protein HYV26_10230 [Candidatus Hydrogenedentes bacterium]|nr:hypothetical protein [Candidatus Hydrogenedentota bacterium]